MNMIVPGTDRLFAFYSTGSRNERDEVTKDTVLPSGWKRHLDPHVTSLD